ncbi:MAG: efflux RND transporter periplasmic adaptor subunit [Candidatus Thiodiazotropha sp. (ex Epidulcina cf. delphinae)]|nr:efflux RND transporter periplasmic adaptor subunit [Candidatus Thiodiazotropha sp. (ex Epidulcina cf. delphinae)]
MRVVVIFCLLLSGQSLARDLQAVTDWHNRMALSTVASGMVNRVNVAVGEVVSRGSVLIELDLRQNKAELAAAESRLEAATQQNDEARRELDRSLELYDRTMLSDHERKQAEIEAATADAAYREAQAKLVGIRLQREYSRVTAPFDGIVERIHVQPGQAVINRFNAIPLLTLLEHGVMKAVADVDERTAAKLEPGTGVRIGVRGQWLDGKIAFIGIQPMAGDAEGAKYRLEASFTPMSGMRLRAGEKAVMRLRDE